MVACRCSCRRRLQQQRQQQEQYTHTPAATTGTLAARRMSHHSRAAVSEPELESCTPGGGAVSSSAYGSPVGSRSPGRGASPAFNIRKVPEEAEDTRLLGWVLSVRVTRNVEVLSGATDGSHIISFSKGGGKFARCSKREVTVVVLTGDPSSRGKRPMFDRSRRWHTELTISSNNSRVPPSASNETMVI